MDLVHAGGALACWQVGWLDEALAAAEDAGIRGRRGPGNRGRGRVRGQTPLRPLLDRCLPGWRIPIPGSRGYRRRARIPLSAGGRGSGGPGWDSFCCRGQVGRPSGFQRAGRWSEAGSIETEITAAFSVCPLCANPAPGSGAAILHRCPAEPSGPGGVGATDHRGPAPSPVGKVRVKGDRVMSRRWRRAQASPWWESPASYR